MRRTLSLAGVLHRSKLADRVEASSALLHRKRTRPDCRAAYFLSVHTNPSRSRASRLRSRTNQSMRQPSSQLGAHWGHIVSAAQGAPPRTAARIDVAMLQLAYLAN